MYHIGIDPGLEGCISGVKSSGELCLVEKIPVTFIKRANKENYNIPALVELFNKIESQLKDFTITIERQISAPEQGVTSVCTLCDGYGVLKGLAYSTKKEVNLVRPAIWKRDLLAGMAAEKQSSVRIVERLHKDYPMELDHNVADSILIAEWGRRQFILRKARL